LLRLHPSPVSLCFACIPRSCLFASPASLARVSLLRLHPSPGNALFLSRFVRDCAVRDNDFTAIGDSAILVVGATGEHRTNSKVYYTHYTHGVHSTHYR
jgi:hypothetical protein